MRLLGARPCTANQSRAHPLSCIYSSMMKGKTESRLTDLTTSREVDISHLQRQVSNSFIYLFSLLWKKLETFK